ncbi:hydantoin utilization protein A [Octadecabacter arcticus 238]|jgi:N-methylhydantoinase A|uniref:Hydantoin utilization protein A n=1 Tax=Octadecabacter arcticus 238 TaxID=391616 RepID=M9RQV4_9RHOB|nr:hydantoinase/oxoprolinase family protein [Octadecabacter arcticus]AGI74118.1 hydantoin utilization protein A [Octadecabacter arcticus 238]
MIVLGVDVGGTFTDFVLADLEKQELTIHKTSSTPANPAIGVVNGLKAICEKAGIRMADIDSLFHGTTVGTNAMLEHDGAVTGMITNAGFRDVLHIGRHQRPQHYSIMQDLPWQNRPLIRRRHRQTVAGRLDAAGQELIPLDEAALRSAARTLLEQGVEAVLVGFLFSYVNPAHEQRAAQILREEMPDVFVTTSSDVAPQFREFERFTTGAMSAFIGPKVRRYITQLQEELTAQGLKGELRVMTSSGGVATPEMIAQKPASTLLSGLVAGVRGGAWVGSHIGANRLITLDIGGTSADIGIVMDGRLTEADARSASIAGFPVMLPMIDIHTIGAGGGSIAHVDRGGAFRVGPESAGADPGPAAYGKGGERPTVTDANLLLGRLAAENFLGGDMKLDVEAARRVITTLADQLGRTPEETAEGALTVLNSNMANAIRSRTVQKGIDPRDFTLSGFGGAGPLHAAEVAGMLGVRRVLIPPHPGITSAMGLLTADLEYHALRTAFAVKGAVDHARLTGLFDNMEAELNGIFDRDGVPDTKRRMLREGDLRYVGQGYELKIDMPDGVLDDAALEQVWQDFHDRHRAEYGHAFEASPIEIVTIKVRGLGEVDKLGTPPEISVTGDATPVGQRRCVFRIAEELQTFDTPYYDRASFPVGHCMDGPAILLQTDSTTVVPPGWRFHVDKFANVLMTREEA